MPTETLKEEDGNRLLELVSKYGVNTVVCGHIHRRVSNVWRGRVKIEALGSIGFNLESNVQGRITGASAASAETASTRTLLMTIKKDGTISKQEFTLDVLQNVSL